METTQAPRAAQPDTCACTTPPEPGASARVMLSVLEGYVSELWPAAAALALEATSRLDDLEDPAAREARVNERVVRLTLAIYSVSDQAELLRSRVAG